MILKHKQLIGLLVKNQNGQILGQVKDFEFETNSFEIIKFVVSSSKLVKKILVQDLIISKDQIIEINNKEIIVDNNLISKKQIAEEFVST